MFLDSPNFNAPAYYEDLIKESSLAELMQAASSLSAGQSCLICTGSKQSLIAQM
jgi:hypothetical protein